MLSSAVMLSTTRKHPLFSAVFSSSVPSFLVIHTFASSLAALPPYSTSLTTCHANQPLPIRSPVHYSTYPGPPTPTYFSGSTTPPSTGTSLSFYSMTSVLSSPFPGSRTIHLYLQLINQNNFFPDYTCHVFQIKSLLSSRVIYFQNPIPSSGGLLD